MPAFAQVNLSFKLSETFAFNTQGSATSVDYSLPSIIRSWNAATTVPITEVWSGQIALSAGTATIDFTALPRPGRTALDISTLNIWAVYISVPTTSVQMTFREGATNGYPSTFASLGDGLSVDDGASAFFIDENAGFGVVNGANSTIDVAGTAANVFNFALAAGV